MLFVPIQSMQKHGLQVLASKVSLPEFENLEFEVLNLLGPDIYRDYNLKFAMPAGRQGAFPLRISFFK